MSSANYSVRTDLPVTYIVDSCQISLSPRLPCLLFTFITCGLEYRIRETMLHPIEHANSSDERINLRFEEKM